MTRFIANSHFTLGQWLITDATKRDCLCTLEDASAYPYKQGARPASMSFAVRNPAIAVSAMLISKSKLTQTDMTVLVHVLLRGMLRHCTDGAARGRGIKLKVKLKEPSRMLEGQQEQQTDNQQDVRIPGGQKKKRRRQ